MIDLELKDFIQFTHELYGPDFIPLHRPIFLGNEKKYLSDCIDSNFVSSAGPKISEFENKVANFVGAENGIATVNGTSALHIALVLSGVRQGDEVITQALTFVATANAIRYCNAEPIFVDVDQDTLGMSPHALRRWLEENTFNKDSKTYNKNTNSHISACLPMHTFGLPCRIVEIADVCKEFNIALIEDTAESLGSFVNGVHTGNFGLSSAFSFNGNKIITTGGGGLIATNDNHLAKRAKHLTTTAKIPHDFEYWHDETGYNYRMPNINAALGLAQMENFKLILERKRKIAEGYRSFFSKTNFQFIEPIKNTTTNFWLNAVITNDRKLRDEFLKKTNKAGVMSRPIWRLMPELPMYSHCQSDDLFNSKWLSDRVVNIPSSVPII